MQITAHHPRRLTGHCPVPPPPRPRRCPSRQRLLPDAQTPPAPAAGPAARPLGRTGPVHRRRGGDAPAPVSTTGPARGRPARVPRQPTGARARAPVHGRQAPTARRPTRGRRSSKTRTRLTAARGRTGSIDTTPVTGPATPYSSATDRSAASSRARRCGDCRQRPSTPEEVPATQALPAGTLDQVNAAEHSVRVQVETQALRQGDRRHAQPGPARSACTSACPDDAGRALMAQRHRRAARPRSARGGSAVHLSLAAQDQSSQSFPMASRAVPPRARTVPRHSPPPSRTMRRLPEPRTAHRPRPHPASVGRQPPGRRPCLTRPHSRSSRCASSRRYPMSCCHRMESPTPPGQQLVIVVQLDRIRYAGELSSQDVPEPPGGTAEVPGPQQPDQRHRDDGPDGPDVHRPGASGDPDPGDRVRGRRGHHGHVVDGSARASPQRTADGDPRLRASSPASAWAPAALCCRSATSSAALSGVTEITDWHDRPRPSPLPRPESLTPRKQEPLS